MKGWLGQPLLAHNENTGDLTDSDSKVTEFRYMTMIAVFVVVYPLCLIKSMTGFRYFAVAILIIVIITLVVCIGEAPLFYNAYKDDPRYVINWLPTSDMVDLGWF